MRSTTSPYLSCREAADLLGYHPSSIRKMIYTGVLPAARVSEAHRWRIRRSDVEALLRPDSAR